jgi:hypothetical protein
MMDCIKTELKDVEDTSLISYVAEAITKEEIRSLYDSFCKQDVENESSDQAEDDTYPETKCEEDDDAFIPVDTILGQQPSIENNPEIKDQTQEVKEIVEFW